MPAVSEPGPAVPEPARQTPVLGDYEVVVVGGGPAGITAAASAARSGRSTILIERYGYLGGAGTAGGLSTFCGLHANVHGEHRRVIRGLADDLLGRLTALDGLSAPHLSLGDRVAAQAFDISAYKIAADELVTGSGATLLYHAMVTGVSMTDDNRIGAVFVEELGHFRFGRRQAEEIEIEPAHPRVMIRFRRALPLNLQ